MDIVKRLRIEGAYMHPTAEMCNGAAYEIERLRGLLARYRDETPLGHQPHMIAHLVDEALGRVPNV